VHGHFWSGSRCFVQLNGRAVFHAGVTAASDILVIKSDLTNRIPDKSWMLYLLELFDRTGIPIELNLIAQFNNMDNFWAIFGGVNRYKFTSVLPLVGHSYFRQIELVSSTQRIRYHVVDQTDGKSESFEFPISGGFEYQGMGQFTGVEWWNRINDSPFPVRYEIEISSIRCKTPDAWRTYNLLVPDSDNINQLYPVGFASSIKNGEIVYTIGNGETTGGLSFSLAPF
jgi:hypothetical protein